MSTKPTIYSYQCTKEYSHIACDICGKMCDFFRNDNKKLAKARKIVLGDELPIPINVYAKKLLSCEKIENGYVVSWHTGIRSTTSKIISGLMINVCHRCYVQKLHCSNGHYVQKVFDMINSRTYK